MEQTAIFVKTFKTIRADGHAVRTIYVLMENGLVQIERRIVSTELNIGFIEIRRFGKFTYQYESMIFKLESFTTIATDILGSFHKIDLSQTLKANDVLCPPNDKMIIRITVKQ
jgi:hypothetical protein